MKKLILLLCSLFIVDSLFAQTDSIGVYAIRDAEVQHIETIKYNQIKISLGKANLVFSGSTSSNRFKAIATFRLYFGIPSPYDVAKYAFFTPAYSVKDFGVGRFTVKNKNRQITTAMVSIFGATLGGNTADNLNIVINQLSDYCYEIKISGEPGEYCIMPLVSGTGGYTGVYDFAIE